MRCLIVDDGADFVDAARGLLECQGVSVIGVASTSEGAAGGPNPSPVMVISTHAAQDFADMVETSPASRRRLSVPPGR